MCNWMCMKYNPSYDNIFPFIIRFCRRYMVPKKMFLRIRKYSFLSKTFLSITSQSVAEEQENNLFPPPSSWARYMGSNFRIPRRASRAGFTQNARVYKGLGQKSGFFFPARFARRGPISPSHKKKGHFPSQKSQKGFFLLSVIRPQRYMK